MTTRNDLAPLWAPWRMEYILGEKSGGCFLCDIARAPARRDRRNLLLCRGAHGLVVMNRYPYNNGHLLVAPYRHVRGIEELNAAERAEWMDLTARAVAALRATMRPDGFNVGVNLGKVAGAGLEAHIHQHIVPRWNGDTNFMPVVAGVKVIPQSLLSAYDQLRPHFG